MTKRITTIILFSLLALMATACSVSFTTAKIDAFAVGKNEKATPPATSFDTGEKIFAVTDVSGLGGKHKIALKVLTENVAGKGKGESVFDKTADMESSGQLWIAYSLPAPGDYKVDVSLLDDSGKEVDKKSANFSVKGSAPAPAAPASKDDDEDKDSEDK